jgi:hypothetical protein
MRLFSSKALLLTAAIGLSVSTHAQTAGPPIGSISDWRTANDTVGQFERGHADLLRWEADNLPRATPPAPDTGPRWTLTDAIVSAQRKRPDLIARPGLNALERAALQTAQRELALQVERAWLQAVAARQTLHGWRQRLLAAEVGTELGLRMAHVGNWTAAQQQAQALNLLAAQADLLLAEHQAHVAVLELWRLTGTPIEPDRLAQQLPATLPAATAPQHLGTNPLAALERQALQQHPTWPLLAQQAERAARSVGDLSPLHAAIDSATAPDRARATPQALPSLPTQPRWPHRWEQALAEQLKAAALERRIRVDVRTAHSAWQTAHRLAQETATQAQRLVTALEENKLQRYNGMFNSTWDLLQAANARLEAVQATQSAHLAALLADADLRAVLDGLPYSGSSPGTPSGTPAAQPKH